MWRTLLHPHPLPLLPWGVVLALALWAVALESRGRRLNPAALAGLLVVGLGVGWLIAGAGGVFEAGLAALVLALPYLALALASRGGLRDAATMAVIGSWLGLQAGILALLSISLAGVLYALGFAAHRRRLAVALAATSGVARVVVWSVLGGDGQRGVPGAGPGLDDAQAPAEELPYAPAIFAGLAIAAVGSLLW